MMQKDVFAPAVWEQIPDLGLYMDQVVTYVTSILLPLHGEQEKEILTSSMVNNYVKQGLIPRPQGKKYTREHLALLLMISFLKKTMAMEDIKRLLDAMGDDICAGYQLFAACQKKHVNVEPSQVPMDAAIVMEKAIFVAAARLDCLNALNALAPQQEPEKVEKSEKKAKKEK